MRRSVLDRVSKARCSNGSVSDLSNVRELGLSWNLSCDDLGNRLTAGDTGLIMQIAASQSLTKKYNKHSVKRNALPRCSTVSDVFY